MAFPSVVNTVNQELTATASQSVSLPPSLAVGNLLMMFTHLDESSDTGYFTTPTGWTEVYQPVAINNNGYLKVAVFSRVVDGSENANVTLERATTSGLKGVAIVSQFSGADSGRIDYANNVEYSSTHVTPEVVASWGSSDNLFLSFLHTRYHALSASPASYTQVASRSISFRGGATLALKQLVSASDNPEDVILSSVDAERRSLTLVVGPPAAVVPSLTVTQTTVTPGGTISGTYANYATVPTTLTVSDGTNSITVPTPTIVDNGAGGGTYSGTMPALPTTGSASGVLFGDVTVELS